MKDNTRLLISFQLDDENTKGWGYDAPFFLTGDILVAAIKDDFQDWPTNQGINIAYDTFNKDLDVTDADALAAQSLAFLLVNGAIL